MIIVTGPGRSGTFLIARLYKELGFAPGGRWNKDVNAGLEAGDVVRVNNNIIRDLGISGLGPPVEGAQPPEFAAGLWHRFVPGALRERIRASMHLIPFFGATRKGLLERDRILEVVAKYRTRLHEIAEAYDVVKDPRFCWTTYVWVEAGIDIDHVLVCTRTLEAMASSRSAAGHYRGLSEDDIKNAMAYGLGICMATLYDYRLDYSIVRYPDFVQDPAQLYSAMRFPRHVPEEEFMQAVAKVIDAGLVHDRT